MERVASPGMLAKPAAGAGSDAAVRGASRTAASRMSARLLVRSLSWLGEGVTAADGDRSCVRLQLLLNAC